MPRDSEAYPAGRCHECGQFDPPEPTFTPVDPELARSMIGEGIHTGLRKGCEGGSEAWRAIHDMPDGSWSAALRFLIDGLDSMGYVLCEKPEAPTTPRGETP